MQDKIDDNSTSAKTDWWELSCHVTCISCNTDVTKFVCNECGVQQALATPCGVEGTSNKRFAVALNEIEVAFIWCVKAT